jgi:peptidoglycan/xylan/chitin deacetylase (PgdA/CDA1 family)
MRASKTAFRRLAREAIARCLLWSGIVGAIRLLFWRDRVLILVYHDPKPEVMDSHLRYLCKIAQPIGLSDIHDKSNGRPRFIITIDDGHAGNVQLLEVCKAHGIRPTIFLCSCIVGTRRQFWWRHGQLPAADIERLKRLRNADRLSQLAALGFSQDADDEAPAALSQRHVAHMKPCVDFQSHGRFHPILTCCDDRECQREITQSRHEIERLVGGECRHFAYPNGNYGEREIAMLRSAGYRTARTLDIGWNGGDCDPFRLKAAPVSDDSSVAWFAVQISLIPAYIRYLRQGSLFGRSPQFIGH